MKLLVLGSGGREHALAWRCGQTVGDENVFLHPGNAGTVAQGLRTLGDGALSTAEAIGARAKALGISLVVIGPEALLAEGYADTLRGMGLLVVGPGRAAARLETSKIFAKEFMTRADVPTAPYTIASSAEELEAQVGKHWPVVVKLDGLAAGKGVVIAKGPGDVRDFADRIWKDGEFGPGPHRVVVEGFIAGRELSYMGLCDGTRFVPLASATDYKRVGDGDTGPNTGGMGAVSPSPYVSSVLEAKIASRVTGRVLAGLAREGLDYRGVLYCGLMIDANGDPHVLEFNTRFGDPETQAVLLRAGDDFVELLERTARGTLTAAAPPRFRDETAVYVVAAAESYPAKPVTGDAIVGLERLPGDARLFFSGVAKKGDALVTSGGRVLGVGSLGRNADEARKKAYAALEQVRFRGMHFRHDIAAPTR